MGKKIKYGDSLKPKKRKYVLDGYLENISTPLHVNFYR